MLGGLINTSPTHRNIAEIKWDSRRSTTGDGKCIGTNYQLMGNFKLNTIRRCLRLVLDDYVESIAASARLAKEI